jgi:hypothetical protein
MTARLLFALALIACRPSSDGDPTKVTVESKEDATEAIVDDNYRFKLAWPGKGWKLMRQHDISKMSADAVAGAMFGQSRIGIVIVEHVPGMTLDGFTDLIVQTQDLADKQVEKRERTKLHGIDANRIVTTGSIESTAFRYHGITFLHQGYGYQLLAFGERNDVSPAGGEVQPFFDAFSIVPGKVSGRAAKPIVTAANGPGWRVTDGVFESVTGVRVRPKEPWRLLVGNDLTRANTDAEIGISHSNPDVYAVVLVERAPPAAHRQALLARMRANLVGTVGKPWSGTFANQPIELARITREDGFAFEYLHGMRIEGDRVVQVLLWYPSGDRERAAKVIPGGLASFELMPDKETTALATALERAPDTQAAVGPRYALRDGVYRNFIRRWQWTKPHASWRATAGDAARARTGTDAELFLLDPRRNLTGFVFSDSNVDASYHASAVDAVPGKKSKPSTVQLGDQSWQVSTIDSSEDWLHTRHRVATATNGNLGLRVTISGLPTDLERHGAAVDAVIAGFRFDDRPMIENTGGEYRDHRFGFALKTPGGWTFADQFPAQNNDRTFVTWTRGLDQIVGVAAAALPIADEKWALDFLEQLMRDSASGFAIGSATRSDAMLAGHRARRLRWAKLDVYVLLRNGLVYALITTRGDTTEFRLLSE